MPGLHTEIGLSCPSILGSFHSSKRRVNQAVLTLAGDFWHGLTLQIAEIDNE
jgi:hypothetical protein